MKKQQIRMAAVAGMALLLTPAFQGAYQYYYTDNLTTVDSTKWWQNGSVTPTSGGLTAPTANGGSLISKMAVPDGTAEYEVRTTLTLTANGGTYAHYARATTNAMSGPGAQGSYYSVELQNPTFNGPVCTATLAAYKREGGVITLVGSATVSCRNGMTMRSVMRNGGSLLAYTDNRMAMHVSGLTGLTTGQPGVGAWNTPSGNAVAKADLGLADKIAPNQPSPSQVSTWVFPNSIDVQMQPPGDDVNGTGVYMYHVDRNGSFLLQTQSSAFTDATVQAGTTYQYTIWPVDYHGNWGYGTIVNITSAPAGAIDPRQPGVKHTAASWGAMGEQIDLQSGNLNFSYPLVKAEGRGGWGVTFALSYNSQLWRRDANATWKLGQDVGYGFGWRLMAGSITPYWGNYWNIHHYVFTDATGAEYRLDQNSGNVWTSKSGYMSYDANSYRLYFNDGSFWQMDAVSAGAEQDAGTRYPTVIQDSNGNQVLIRYQTGLGVGWENSSARLSEIEDVRAVMYCCPTKYRTYSFTYNTDAIPHLSGVTNYINTSEGYSFAYTVNAGLWSPWGVSFGNAQRLQSMTMTGLGLTTTFGSTSSGELTSVVFPYGGELQWDYRDFTFNGNRTYREVQYRRLRKQSGGGLTQQTFVREPGDAQFSLHSKATVQDPGGAGVASEKIWTFEMNTASAYVGLVTQLEERETAPAVLKSRQNYTWTQDVDGRPYVGTVLQTLDPGQGYQKQSKTEQVLDRYGNLLQTKIYAYDSLVSPARTYDTTYLATSPYVTRYIRNRPLLSTVTEGGQTWTIANRVYDGRGVYAIGGSQPRQHDGVNYPHTFTTRGNLSSVSSPGKYKNLDVNITGGVIATDDSQGHSASYSNTTATNFAAVSTITPNGNSTLATSLGYSAFLGLQNVTGPNGSAASVSYDNYARPQTSYSPHGAVTTHTYASSAPFWKQATTNGHWTKTTMDGFGRPVKVETGDGGGMKSAVETEYDACGCTPMGKVKRVSQPYGAGGSATAWTVYQYDGLGRVTSVTAPGGTGTTTYVYQGNKVTVTDPAGKWKAYETDVFGNLKKVTEPAPGGDTSYDYDSYNKLKSVTMTRGAVTQTRTFTYDVQQRLSTAANPETGTVTYGYNADSTVASVVDGKNQRVEYGYDGYQRVTQVRRYPVNGGAEDGCQRVDYAYDSNPWAGGYSANAAGRVAAVQWGSETGCGMGRWREMYSYTTGGLAAKKLLRLQKLNFQSQVTWADLELTHGYNNEGQATSMNYPGYWVDGGSGPYQVAGSQYTFGYDGMARLNRITETSPLNFQHISNILYGAANEITSISYGTGAVQSRSYNTRLQMTRVTTAGVMDLEYKYSATANNGQITGMKNWISGEDVVYTYDALKRLETAATVGPEWGQSFGYDGFGNLLSQTVTKGSAPSMSVAVNGTTNRVTGWGYDGNGNVTSMPGFTNLTYDVANRVTGVTLSGGGTEQYGYGADNKRIWRTKTTGVNEVYLYGLSGERVGTYRVQLTNPNTGDIGFWLVALDPVIPKGLQHNRDRLGSVMYSGSARYYPYGEESPVTAQDRDKFGTYQRDGGTGLDYADQRYYLRAQGRFLTADPYVASAGAGEPGSWNRYGYVRGDPVNLVDPRGLFDLPAELWQPLISITVFGRFGGRGGGGGGGAGANPHEAQLMIGPDMHISPPEPHTQSCEMEYAPTYSDEAWRDILSDIAPGSDEWEDLHGALPDGKTGERPVLPYALAAASAAQWTVYWFQTPTGQRYIGISLDVGMRMQAHVRALAAQGLTIHAQGTLQLPKMNYAAAKGIEQLFIEAALRNGQQLLNRINSVSPRSVPYYQQFTTMGQHIKNCYTSTIPTWMR